MAVLIDASILIEAERGRLHLEPLITPRADEEAFISVVTVSELLHGVHRTAFADQRARRSAFVEGVIERLPVLTIDTSVARAHAQVWADLAAAGRLIGPHDLWLAASCIAHGLTMVTANVREFERVPGLDLEVWAEVPINDAVRLSAAEDAEDLEAFETRAEEDTVPHGEFVKSLRREGKL